MAREIALWGSVQHENIHSFYGFATGQAFGKFGALISPVMTYMQYQIEPDFLIEWCTNGDANQFLARYGQQMVMSERINLVCNPLFCNTVILIMSS